MRAAAHGHRDVLDSAMAARGIVRDVHAEVTETRDR